MNKIINITLNEQKQKPQNHNNMHQNTKEYFKTEITTLIESNKIFFTNDGILELSDTRWNSLLEFIQSTKDLDIFKHYLNTSENVNDAYIKYKIHLITEQGSEMLKIYSIFSYCHILEPFMIDIIQEIFAIDKIILTTAITFLEKIGFLLRQQQHQQRKQQKQTKTNEDVATLIITFGFGTLNKNILDELFEKLLTYEKYPRNFETHKYLNQLFNNLWFHCYKYPDLFQKHKHIIDVMGKNCLHYLFRSSNRTFIRELLDNNPELDINLVAKDEIVEDTETTNTPTTKSKLAFKHEELGSAPVHSTLFTNTLDLVMEYGADPSIRDKFGRAVRDFYSYYYYHYECL